MKKLRQTPRRRKSGDDPSPPDGRAVAEDDEKVREASEESFPASDAPSFVATTGSIADGRDSKPPKQRR